MTDSKDDSDNTHGLEANLALARETSVMAHGVVIKLREMGLPSILDRELASLSTDLGDLWGAQKLLAERLEGLLNSSQDWEAVGGRLVDLKASIDHIAWHLKSVRRPLGRITRFAYRQAEPGNRYENVILSPDAIGTKNLGRGSSPSPDPSPR